MPTLKTLTLALLLAAGALPWAGCGEKEGGGKDRDPRAEGSRDKAEGDALSAPPDGGPAPRVSHARVFSIRKRADTTVIEVRKPWQGSTADFTYLLVPGAGAKAGAPVRSFAPAPGTLAVPVPLERAVTMTTTNLRHFEALGALDALVGIGGGRYACSPAIRERLRAGRIRDVGDDANLDAEALTALRPDLVFTYVVGGSSDGGMAKLREIGISSLVEGSYMEESPLGRAEWIKFTAAFLGKESLADSLFAEVESSYSSLAARAREAPHKPTVFVGAPFGGVWWMPSGRTYVARLLEDAGADFLWADDTTRGSLNLDMEAVLGKAAGADYWLNAGDWRDLGEALERDARHAHFKAFREGRVYNHDAIRCESGGMDFFETGSSRPDLILADLVSIFHPELLPGHARRWYRKLEKPE